MQGRSFVSGGRGPVELATIDASAAREPIRVYVGLESTTGIAARVSLVLAELDRTGAWDRKILVVAGTTGAGEIDPVATDSVELMYNGDTAIVACSTRSCRADSRIWSTEPPPPRSSKVSASGGRSFLRTTARAWLSMVTVSARRRWNPPSMTWMTCGDRSTAHCSSVPRTRRGCGALCKIGAIPAQPRCCRPTPVGSSSGSPRPGRIWRGPIRTRCTPRPARGRPHGCCTCNTAPIRLCGGILR
ncbi:hypothetical protein RHRU231_650012 [Rhodococcus ruber]|uniref:Alpha/beta-hydrolase catalytic domain-containing protein n=1 Tax=Rhodococcus ruber TaxID=1830 RepID=A0A098BN54_9NOCA|nr:Predicted membrane protein (DUF2319 [Rhodococcus aetherivorans]CDZ90149.1 hypothetical protein RHRU231_650012 [Rhodococcus ruber]